LRLSGDREDGLGVGLRVGEPVDEVSSTGAGRCGTHAEPAGEGGVCLRHESGRLFVSGGDELDPVPLSEGGDERKRRVADDAEDAADSPRLQLVDEDVDEAPARWVHTLPSKE